MLVLFSSWIIPKNVNIDSHIYLNASLPLIFICFIVYFFLTTHLRPTIALKGIFLGALISLLAFLYGQMTLLLPSPEYAIHTNSFYNDFIFLARKNILPFFFALAISVLVTTIFFTKLRLIFNHKNNSMLPVFICSILGAGIYAIAFTIF